MRKYRNNNKVDDWLTSNDGKNGETEKKGKAKKCFSTSHIRSYKSP